LAEPTDFPESNLTLVGTPEDKAAGTVIDLPTHRYRDLDGNQHVISCWKLTVDEIAEILRTGVIWFHAWGHTHPPISIQGTCPFKRDEDAGG
jgi:hypothetical protein